MLFGTDPSTVQQKLATFGVHPGVLGVTHDETRDTWVVANRTP